MSRDLLVRADLGTGDVVTRIEADDAGWQHLNMEVRRLRAGATWRVETTGTERVFVMLGGTASFQVGDDHFQRVGRRPNVFSGMPHAVFVPPERTTVITAGTSCEIATTWTEANDCGHRPQHITPNDVEIEIRGGGHATRQINSIVPPGFDCERLVCVEVFTPGGNWSSYPPHKHDVHIERGGIVVEAELEEFYYYKVRGDQGYAIQRVYTADGELDFCGAAYSDDVVLVPRGYHPVSAPVGYDCYYLNFLAGSAQSLANSDDPDHAWIQEDWGPADPRLPMVTHEMEFA